MARMASSEDLLNHSITLIDGSTDTIIDVLASGYKVNSRGGALPVRTVALIDDELFEISKDIPGADIKNSKKGYVVFNDPDDGEEVRQMASTAKKSGKVATASVAATDRRNKNTRTTKEKKALESAEVKLTEVQKELAEDLASRVMDALARMSRIDQNGSKILNKSDLSFHTEYSTDGISITANVIYDMSVEPEKVDKIFIDPKIVKRAAKRVTVNGYSKKLGKAIERTFGIDLEQFVVGIVLEKDGEEVVVCGESIDGDDKIVAYVLETGKFRRISIVGLAAYTIAQEDYCPDEDDEDEDQDEAPNTRAKPLTKPAPESAPAKTEKKQKQLTVARREPESGYDEDCEPAPTAKLFAAMGKRFGVKVEQGSVFTDGEDELVMLGIDDEGGLLVERDGSAVGYDADEIPALLDVLSPVLDELSEAVEAGDLHYLGEEELQQHAIELGVISEKKARKASREELLKLLK